MIVLLRCISVDALETYPDAILAYQLHRLPRRAPERGISDRPLLLFSSAERITVAEVMVSVAFCG